MAQTRQNTNTQMQDELTLNLDNVVATQPELGPSIPDGGFGWVVFIGTLFFQALIPCLTVNFGILLAFSKLENGTSDDKNITLWDEKMLYVPLVFAVARTCFDAPSRSIAAKTTTPRLVAVVGTCLTCAGLLFMWMGMTGSKDDWLFVPAGLFAGCGASIVMVQCEVLLAQYFRVRLPMLNQVSQLVAAMGFLFAPMALGQHILNSSIYHVVLWYQAIVLQGLVVALFFRKPLYLKLKKQNTYKYVSTDAEDDIFSKSSRELQLKRQTSTERSLTKIEITESASTNHKEENQWVKFEEDEDQSENWEELDDEKIARRRNWEPFEGEEADSPTASSESPFVEGVKTQGGEGHGQRKKPSPSPLFSDTPVNNNTTYAYDDEIVTESGNSNVFLPNNITKTTFGNLRDLLKEPTFYKSLLTITANKYSSFAFYTLFPSYLYTETTVHSLRKVAGLMGALALVQIIFLSFQTCCQPKKKRPLCILIFYFIGCVGYALISDFSNEPTLLVGAAAVVASITSIDHFSKPLLKISGKGETSNEHSLLTTISAAALLQVLLINVTYKTCFRLAAVIHLFTASLWLANYVYKKIRGSHNAQVSNFNSFL